MSEERSRYRRELKGWSKNELIREVERLRAITFEHAERPGGDTAGLGADMVDAAGDPSQLLGLASRIGSGFDVLLAQRISDLP